MKWIKKLKSKISEFNDTDYLFGFLLTLLLMILIVITQRY